MNALIQSVLSTNQFDARQVSEFNAAEVREAISALVAEDKTALADALWLTRLMAGRDWIWIEGNHDAGPVEIGGSHRAEMPLGPLTFRHIADATQSGEVSGHFHPKLRLGGQSRPCFLLDAKRLIMPAFGAYTGGLDVRAPEISSLFAEPKRIL